MCAHGGAFELRTGYLFAYLRGARACLDQLGVHVQGVCKECACVCVLVGAL